MTEHNIATEVPDGLRKITEHRSGKRTLHTVHVNRVRFPNSPLTPFAKSATASTSPGPSSHT